MKYNWITGNFESKTVGNGKQPVLLVIANENRNIVDIDIYIHRKLNLPNIRKPRKTMIFFN